MKAEVFLFFLPSFDPEDKSEFKLNECLTHVGLGFPDLLICPTPSQAPNFTLCHSEQTFQKLFNFKFDSISQKIHNFLKGEDVNLQHLQTHYHLLNHISHACRLLMTPFLSLFTELR
jgi:hypothetical protein